MAPYMVILKQVYHCYNFVLESAGCGVLLHYLFLPEFAVEEKLNELLDHDGGISKRKVSF